MTSRVLVIRLSAIGDVAILLPLLYAAAHSYPQTEFVMMTQQGLVSLFAGAPPNVRLIGLDLKGKQHSLLGLLRHLQQTELGYFTHIIDCHNVLRTIIIRNLLRYKTRRTFYLVKNRNAQQRLLSSRPIEPLTPVWRRYATLFEQAGFPLPEKIDPPLRKPEPLTQTLFPQTAKGEDCWIGIAPFSQHKGKIYPLDKMLEVVGRLVVHPNVRIFLFGGGEQESQTIDQWIERHPALLRMPQGTTLLQEVQFMQHLDLMVSMDSANLHFASLVATPVVSFWGQTHPDAGFFPWNQSRDLIAQSDLPCRPCSIFGNKPCQRGDWACLHTMTARKLYERIAQHIEPKRHSTLS